MKGKNLLILVVVAVILAALAFMSSRNKARTSPDVIGKLVLKDLALNDVEKLVVSVPSCAMTFTRENDTWVAPTRFNYPADFQKIRGILLKLSELKVGQVMRLTDSQKASLKIVAPTSGSTTNSGTLLELFGPKDTKLATVLLGESRQRKVDANRGFGGFGGYPDGRYLSIDGGKTVYLVADTLEDVSSQPKDWLDAELLSVNGTDISEVTITAPDKKELRLLRKGTSSLEVEGLAADEETEASKIYGIESALSYLRFADVADPSLPDTKTGMDKPSVFKVTTSKGQIYTAKIGASPTNSTERYVRFELALKPADTNAPASTEAGSTNAVSAAADAAEARKQLEEETQSLNAKVGKWTYLIESYKTDSMLSTRESLVKKKEQPKAEEKPAAVTTEPAAAPAKPGPAAAEAPQPPQAPAPVEAPQKVEDKATEKPEANPK